MFQLRDKTGKGSATGKSRVCAAVGAALAIAALVVGGATPASAESTEIDGNHGTFDWVGTHDFPFCAGWHEDPFAPATCPDAAAIGNFHITVRMDLYGRQVRLRTDWSQNSGDVTMRVDSLIECRKDEFRDDSCGHSDTGQAFADWNTSGTIEETFFLPENGKYFFNLYYTLGINGRSVSPDLPDGGLDVFMGTTHRIKCSDKNTYYCEMA